MTFIAAQYICGYTTEENDCINQEQPIVLWAPALSGMSFQRDQPCAGLVWITTEAPSS